MFCNVYNAYMVDFFFFSTVCLCKSLGLSKQIDYLGLRVKRCKIAAFVRIVFVFIGRVARCERGILACFVCTAHARHIPCSSLLNHSSACESRKFTIMDRL
jgi:hypothetical protein